jgi:hypothetical protein
MSSENSISEKEEKEHHIQEFNKWNATIDEQLPKLSKPQATVLALWSFGIIIVRSCSISAVKLILAGLFDIKENTIRQRLKEFYLDSNDKKGQKRTQINVRECFVFILKWIIKHWKTKQIALAMDATTLGLSFTVLAVSVLYPGLRWDGCAIPVAWTILVPPSNGRTDTKGNEEGEWNKEWIEHGFKHTKREGLGWHRTRMESPARAERVWLAMSLATFYLVIIGGEVDASICESTFPRIHYAAKSNAIKPNRKVSIFRLGWITVILSLIRHKPLRIGCFIPEQWTESPYEIMIHKETYP